MINGTHLLIYSTDADADRAFFRDVLQFKSVDAGHGWLIFALPPAEVGIHPAEGPPAPDPSGQAMSQTVLYLMCDDVRATITSLESKGVSCAPVTEAPWGRSTTLKLPSGAALGLYQPTHATAI